MSASAGPKIRFLVACPNLLELILILAPIGSSYSPHLATKEETEARASEPNSRASELMSRMLAIAGLGGVRLY